MVPSTPGYEDRRDFFIAIRLVGICHAGSLALGNPQCLGGGSECMVGLAGNCSTVPCPAMFNDRRCRVCPASRFVSLSGLCGEELCHRGCYGLGSQHHGPV